MFRLGFVYLRGFFSPKTLGQFSSCQVLVLGFVLFVLGFVLTTSAFAFVSFERQLRSDRTPRFPLRSFFFFPAHFVATARFWPCVPSFWCFFVVPFWALRVLTFLDSLQGRLVHFFLSFLCFSFGGDCSSKRCIRRPSRRSSRRRKKAGWSRKRSASRAEGLRPILSSLGFLFLVFGLCHSKCRRIVPYACFCSASVPFWAAILFLRFRRFVAISVVTATPLKLSPLLFRHPEFFGASFY